MNSFMTWLCEITQAFAGLWTFLSTPLRFPDGSFIGGLMNSVIDLLGVQIIPVYFLSISGIAIVLVLKIKELVL